MTVVLGSSAVLDEAASFFKKISSESCFLYMLPPCIFPVSVHSLYVFCCLAKHRNTLLPLFTDTAVSRCALRAALLLWNWQTEGSLYFPRSCADPALTLSSFLRTVGFKSGGHRKAVLLCYEITLQQQKGSWNDCQSTAADQNRMVNMVWLVMKEGVGSSRSSPAAL